MNGNKICSIEIYELITIINTGNFEGGEINTQQLNNANDLFNAEILNIFLTIWGTIK